MTMAQQTKLGTHAVIATEEMVSGYAASFGLSFAVTSVVSALLVVLKESNEETVLAWMNALTGHHWVTHGLIDIILFVGLGLLLANSGKRVQMNGNYLSATIFGSLVVSGLIIVGFFL